MPDAKMNAWVKDTFGIDLDTYQQQSAPSSQASGSDSGEQASLGSDILGGLKSIGAGIVGGVKAVGEGVVAVGKKIEEGVVVVGKTIEEGVVSVGKTIEEGAVSVGKTIEDGVVAGVKAVGGFINDEAMKLADGDYDDSMKRLDAEIKNVKDAGLDATPYEAQAKNIRDAHAEGLKLPDIASRYQAVSACSARAKTAADQALADVANLKKSAVEGVTAAITDMRDAAKAQIDKIAKENPKKAGLDKQLAALDKSIEEVGKLTDRAERAKQLKAINKTAQALFDEAVGVTNDKSTVEATYGKALKDRYGFDITNPANMPNTHLDQVYKMFDLVPEADVVQSQMRTLNYEPLSQVDDGHGGKKWVKNTGASYGGAQINMGDYGGETWPYTDPKDPTGNTPMPANGFSISTLHELGHSVDDRFKIMDSNGSKSGSGGWRPETLQSTATKFVEQFKAGNAKNLSKPLDDGVLSTAVTNALGGTVNRPDGMSDPDWAVLKTLLDLCASRRSDPPNWPWGATAHDIGGRTYHEAYSGVWVSYETAVRAKALTVRDYQWRAPGEWFAELYAFSFFNQKPPPNGVDSALTAYMYGGSAAGESAPAKTS